MLWEWLAARGRCAARHRRLSAHLCKCCEDCGVVAMQIEPGTVVMAHNAAAAVDGPQSLLTRGVRRPVCRGGHARSGDARRSEHSSPRWSLAPVVHGGFSARRLDSDAMVSQTVRARAGGLAPQAAQNEVRQLMESEPRD